MSINLTISFAHPEAVAQRVKYARIDNTVNPNYITVSPDPVTSPANIATNILNGQYRISSYPIYADGRDCSTAPTIVDTPACQGLISISAYITGNTIVVSYLAPPDIPKVRITVNFPNGGSYTANYINNGNDIPIAISSNLQGDFLVLGQSVCDESSGFYSGFSSQVTVSRDTLPTITQLSNTDGGPGTTRTQIFQIGPNIVAGNRFSVEVYSHPVTVVASLGDTPTSIATALKNAVNATNTTQWNSFGSAPSIGTPGFPPTATSAADQITIVLNYTNQFAAYASVT